MKKMIISLLVNTIYLIDNRVFGILPWKEKENNYEIKFDEI